MPSRPLLTWFIPSCCCWEVIPTLLLSIPLRESPLRKYRAALFPPSCTPRRAPLARPSGDTPCQSHLDTIQPSSRHLGRTSNPSHSNPSDYFSLPKFTYPSGNQLPEEVGLRMPRITAYLSGLLYINLLFLWLFL